MLTRRLGRAGPDITVLGLGSWVFGGAGGFGLGPVDDRESIATIRHAIESGINWIDTAAVYGLGHSEEAVGRAVAPFKRGEDVYIFTKCGQNWYDAGSVALRRDLRPASIRFECEQSLRRLGVDRIDLYQFHWPDDSTGTPIEESWGTMADLIAEGKVRWGGVSNFDVGLLERCAAVRHIESLQVPLSLIRRAALSDVIPWCASHGTGVITYGPLATGLLSGALDRRRIAAFAEDDGRRKLPRFQEPQLSAILGLVDALRETARRLRVSLPSLAAGWAVAAEGVTGTIVGARRPEQVDGWLPAADVELGAADLAEIASVVQRAGL